MSGLKQINFYYQFHNKHIYQSFSLPCLQSLNVTWRGDDPQLYMHTHMHFAYQTDLPTLCTGSAGFCFLVVINGLNVCYIKNYFDSSVLC